MITVTAAGFTALSGLGANFTTVLQAESANPVETSRKDSKKTVMEQLTEKVQESQEKVNEASAKVDENKQIINEANSNQLRNITKDQD